MDKKDKKMCFFMPVDMHIEIKLRSTNKHISMKKWILQAIALKLLNENRMLD